MDEIFSKRTYVLCSFLRRSQSLAKVFNSSKCHRSAYYLNKGQVHLYLIPRCFSVQVQKKKLVWRYFSKSDKLIELFCLYAISSIQSRVLWFYHLHYVYKVSCSLKVFHPTLFFPRWYSNWVFNMQSRNSFIQSNDDYLHCILCLMKK